MRRWHRILFSLALAVGVSSPGLFADTLTYKSWETGPNETSTVTVSVTDSTHISVSWNTPSGQSGAVYATVTCQVYSTPSNSSCTNVSSGTAASFDLSLNGTPKTGTMNVLKNVSGDTGWKINITNSGNGHFSFVSPSSNPVMTGSFSVTPVERTITLSWTNGFASYQFAGVGIVGSPWLEYMRYVAPSATETWYVKSPVGDTNKYQVRVVDLAAWAAYGPVEKLSSGGTDWWALGTDELSDEVGPQKGYSDGVDGITNGASQATPPGTTPSATPSGTKAATSTNPGVSSTPSGVTTPSTIPTPLVPGSPTGSPTQQSQADGVNKILQGLAGIQGQVGALRGDVKAAGGGVYGGGGTDMTGTNARLDSINTNLQKIETRQQKLDDKTAAETAATTAKDNATSQGTSSAGTLTGLLNGQGGAAPTGKGYTVAGGSIGNSLQVHMPSRFGGATIDFNPFANSGMATVISWFRSAMQWLCYVWLGQFLWSQLKDWLTGIGSAQQAKGNPVFAGTGAQATALISAAAISAAVVVAVTALMSWSFDSIGMSSIRSNAMTNPTAGMGATALAMLDTVFPVSTIVTCALARYSFNMYAAALYSTASAVIRFCVA